MDNISALYSSGYIVKNDTTYRVITNHLGSVKLIVNAETGVIVQNIEYDEFGNISSLLNENSLPAAVKRRREFTDFAFAGGIYDADTKLVRFGARDYNPEIGRWTAKDPIGFGGGQSNFYEYCLNDPINAVDLNGLQDVRLNGEKWRLYKSKEHGSTHFHNIRTGEKYFPESNKVYNPNNKNYSSAGNKFVKQFSKALKNTKGLRSVTGAIGSGFWELYDLLIDALKKGKDPCNKNSFLDNFQDAYDSYINTPTFFENIFNNQNGIYSNNLPEV